jgi:hypothetical protein
LVSPIAIDDAEPKAISLITSGVFEGLGDAEGVADGVGEADAFTGIATPLSQTSFFPCLIHVYFLPRQMIC